jgi:hypothetical protein
VSQKRKKGSNVERKQTRMRDFYFEQRQLCRFGFIFLFNTSLRVFTALKKHYLENGITPRARKSGKHEIFLLKSSYSNYYVISGGRRKTALVLADVQHVVTFIVNYADTHAMVLPGRVPGFARDDVKVHFVFSKCILCSSMHQCFLNRFCQAAPQK